MVSVCVHPTLEKRVAIEALEKVVRRSQKTCVQRGRSKLPNQRNGVFPRGHEIRDTPQSRLGSPLHGHLSSGPKRLRRGAASIACADFQTSKILVDSLTCTRKRKAWRERGTRNQMVLKT